MILKLHQRQTPKKSSLFHLEKPLHGCGGSDNFINELLK
jgi:hypothetical protein